jgi:outer membrane protein assembly factor BamB
MVPYREASLEARHAQALSGLERPINLERRDLPQRRGLACPDTGQKPSLHLWCVDRAKGTLLWQKPPLGGGNDMQRTQNRSTPSPCDGREPVVWVLTGTGISRRSTSRQGALVARHPERTTAVRLNWGYGSSPLLHDDSLYVQVLHGMRTDDPSYLLRIDKATGKTIWRVERPTNADMESPDAYTTPALLEVGSAKEIVVTGGDVVTGMTSAPARSSGASTA